MPTSRSRVFAILALVASTFGLVFGAFSTFDYAAHLDRQVNHAIHCSFIPGVPPSTDMDSPCRTAMYSPYAALLRDKWWGGVPISLFAVGAFTFFIAFTAYLVLAGARASKRSWMLLSLLGVMPFCASVLMFFISLTRLGAFCKVCVGIYVSSTVLAVAAGFGWSTVRRETGRPLGSIVPPLASLAGLGVAAILPAVAYVSALPDFKPYLSSCGKLAIPTESHGALLKLPTKNPVQPATLFVDPLCPTCKAFHERLEGEGALERLDVQLVLFPLDSECNWMLEDPLHPGACVLARAVLCGGARARDVLEWSYANQEDLRATAKTSKDALKAKIAKQWGADLASCIDAKATTVKLNQNLQYAVANHVQVSTPQLYLDDQRLCDEDTDLGLRYALAQLAPKVVP
jgi:uncharacterized membrane protein